VQNANLNTVNIATLYGGCRAGYTDYPVQNASVAA
jgi:hypothetical protein